MPRGLRRRDDLFRTPSPGTIILIPSSVRSFDAVVDFRDQAANDPKVLAIKQTLVSHQRDSDHPRASLKLADNGKHVTRAGRG